MRYLQVARRVGIGRRIDVAGMLGGTVGLLLAGKAKKGTTTFLPIECLKLFWHFTRCSDLLSYFHAVQNLL
jgi:hypothetical protein